MAFQLQIFRIFPFFKKISLIKHLFSYQSIFDIYNYKCTKARTLPKRTIKDDFQQLESQKNTKDTTNVTTLNKIKYPMRARLFHDWNPFDVMCLHEAPNQHTSNVWTKKKYKNYTYIHTHMAHTSKLYQFCLMKQPLLAVLLSLLFCVFVLLCFVFSFTFLFIQILAHSFGLKLLFVFVCAFKTVILLC